jgi:hypothetical protein
LLNRKLINKGVQALMVGFICAVLLFSISCSSSPTSQSSSTTTTSQSTSTTTTSTSSTTPVVTTTLPPNPGNLNVTATLSGGEEVPAVATQASGQLILNLNGATGEFNFILTVANITNVTMSHLHLAAKGQNGPPVVWLYPLSGSPQTITGSFNGVISAGIFSQANFVGSLQGQPLSALIDKIKAGEIYVNVHTEQNQNGEIRAQVANPQTNTAVAYQELNVTVTKLEANTLMVQKADSSSLSVQVDNSIWVQLADGQKGSLTDVKPGVKIELYLSPDGKQVLKIELRDQNNAANGFVAGKITGGGLSVQDALGKIYNLEISPYTVILNADGSRGNVNSLKPGTSVEVYYNTATRVVFRVEIEF